MNSLYFYHPMIWKHLKNLASSNSNLDETIVNRIMQFKPTSKEHDTLFWATRLMKGASAIDRTGKLNPFNVSYEPIPTVDATFNKSFGQICLETAESYWKHNNKLSILWSGGIDSTAAALSLIETKPDDCILNIICTQESIAEYPAFYQTHQQLCQVKTSEQFLNLDSLMTDHVVITGDVGDQLMGANLAESLIDKHNQEYSRKDEPWTVIFEFDDPFKIAQFDNPTNAEMAVPWTRPQLDKFVETLESHASASPFPIRSLFDMTWWINFSTKLNYVTTRIPVLILDHTGNHITQIDRSKRRAFYLNDDFQRWSMTNHSIKVSTTPLSFKQPAKDFIFSLNGDLDYTTNKQKEASTNKMLSDGWFGKWKINTNANYAILDNGQVFNSANHMSSDTLTSLFTNQN